MRWGYFSYRFAWLNIALLTLLVLTLGYQAQFIKVDTSTESFLEESHPMRVIYNNFRHEFGRDDKMLITLEPARGVFNFEFLDTLKKMQAELESVPHVEEVTSLINARQTLGKDDELLVGDLMQDWPETNTQLEKLKQQVLASPTYKGMLISYDGNKTSISIDIDPYTLIGRETGFDAMLDGFDTPENTNHKQQEEYPDFLSGEENSELVAGVEAIVDKYRSDDLVIHIAGTPSIAHQLMSVMRQDMETFTSLSFISIALFLALLFRRVSTIFLPLLVAMVSLTCTVGIMSLIDIPFTPIGQSMPSFLLAVGVGNSVHIFAIFFLKIREGDNKKDALAHALGHSGLPIVMTGLTTAGGLLSFTTAEIAHVVDFGIITTIGVLSALFFSLVLLPSLIAVFPVKLQVNESKKANTHLQNLLETCADFSTQHAGKVTAFFAAVICIALFSAMQIRFSHDPIHWFDNEHPLPQASDYIDQYFSGALYMEALIETDNTDAFKSPEFLNKLESAHNLIEHLKVGHVQAKKSFSILDISKEIHQALNENRSEYYTLPQDRQLIAQELLLFENSGSDDLEDVVDTRFSKARLTFMLPAIDAVEYGPYLDEVKHHFQNVFGDTARITITGLMSLMAGTINALMSSLAKTYILAFLIITPLMMLIIGNVRVGLLSMIPNLTPIIITLGVMGWRGFPMDAFTLLTGSIALGLAVDDTIHFMHNYRRFYEQTGDNRLAVRRTLATTGQAMFITSVVLCSGFFVYLLSSMHNLSNFGLLTGFTIIMALLADIILAPALMTLIGQKFLSKTA